MSNSDVTTKTDRRTTAGHSIQWSKRCAVVYLVVIATGWLASLIGVAHAGESVVVVILDDSGSMGQVMADEGSGRPRIEVAKNALQRVIKKLPDGTRFGIMLLNGASTEQGWLIPLGELKRKAALQRVANVYADGGTPLGQSMIAAMDQLLQLRKQQPYADYRLLVVTDGEATDGWLLDQHLGEMVSRGVVVDVIGVDMQAAHSLSSKSHSYRRANDAASFERALTEIFAEESATSDAVDVQANFDKIAGLPDDFARDLLTTWAFMPNQPIGRSAAESTDIELSADQAAHQSASTAGAPTNNYPQGNAQNAPATETGFGVFLFFMLVAMGVIVILMNSFKRK